MPKKTKINHQAITEVVFKNFYLGNSFKMTRLKGGWTNEVWRLQDKDKMYVLKIYDSSSKIQSIKFAIRFAEHLTKQGIEALLPLKNIFGKAIFSVDSYKQAVLYPYINSKTFPLDSPCPKSFVGVAGNLLAKVHEAGNSFHKPLQALIMPSTKESVRIYFLIDEVIKKKLNLTPFDRVIQKVIKLKISRLDDHDFMDNELANLPKTNTHGDFHQANILRPINTNRLVLIDFDKAAYMPRIWEVLLAMSRMCIRRSGEAFLAPLDLGKVYEFFRAYHATYPLDKDEIRLLPLIGQQASRLSTYFLESYYLKQFQIRKTLRPPTTFTGWFWWDRNYDKICGVIKSVVGV